MAWETNENGLVVDEKGNPVWVNEVGEKKSVDYTAMATGLKTAAQQAQQRKEEIRALQDRYSMFADVEDLSAWHSEAQKAMEMLRSAPDAAKDLEEQLQLRFKPTREGYEEKLRAKDKAISDREKEMAELTSHYHQEKKHNSFFTSTFAKDKLTSATLAYKLFAGNFTVQDGKLVGAYDNGDTIYGDDGAVASFDFALAKLAEASPDKALLFKGSNSNGSGANPNGGGGGGKTNAGNISDLKSLKDKAAYIREKYGS